MCTCSLSTFVLVPINNIFFGTYRLQGLDPADLIHCLQELQSVTKSVEEEKFSRIDTDFAQDSRLPSFDSGISRLLSLCLCYGAPALVLVFSCVFDRLRSQSCLCFCLFAVVCAETKIACTCTCTLTGSTADEIHHSMGTDHPDGFLTPVPSLGV